MSAVVIDENVLIVAEKQAPDPHTNDACIRSCIQALREARGQLIVLDAQGLIIQKYRKQLKPLQPSWLGSEFLMWLESNQFRPEHCERVKVTQLKTSFAEVPLELRVPNVANQIFDLDDHVWLAVAKASANSPVILNATDTDWHHWRDRLEGHGFQVKFLCPELMT